MKNVLFILMADTYNSNLIREQLKSYENQYNITIKGERDITKIDYSNFDLVVTRVKLARYVKEYLQKKCTCPIVNSISSQTICDDKRITYSTLLGIVDMPLTSLDENDISLPMVVKEPLGSLGRQVWKCDTMEEVQALKKGYKKMYQQYIPTENGSHIRVIVIGGRCIGAMKITSGHNDFKSNASRGDTIENYELTQEINDMCLLATNVAGTDYCGVDIVIDKNTNKPYLCEMNTNAYTKAFDKATGINTTEIYLQHIFSKL